MIDKYFNWLGIKNEGIRRIIYLVHLIAFPFWYYCWDEIPTYYVGGDFVTLATILSPIWTTIVMKLITWIKQGFDKDSTS